MVEKVYKPRKEDVVAREYTINLHKRLHGCSFKKKAANAIKEIRKFAQKAMGTNDVRVDVKLNKQIWSRGIRSVPRRIRVRIARKRNDDEDAKDEFFSLVAAAEIPKGGLKGLGTKVIDEEDAQAIDKEDVVIPVTNEEEFREIAREDGVLRVMKKRVTNGVLGDWELQAERRFKTSIHDFS